MDCYNEYDTELSFTDIDKDLEILDDFCDLAEYRLQQYKHNDEMYYNIYDLQLCEYKERNNMTWKEVIGNWLEKVSTYYLHEWQDLLDEKYIENNKLNKNGIEYVLSFLNKLYAIAKKYKLEEDYIHLLDSIMDLEREIDSISLYDERDFEIKVVISSENNVYLEKDDELVFVDDITNLDYSFVSIIKEIIKTHY